MNKDISIIVPVYNTAKYLKRCLDSIINQKFDNINYEIIVVNDASTDNSLEIINEYLKNDNRIILIDKKENQGLSEARNSGIEIAQGEYILHIDSDDWIEDNYIYDMVTLAKKENADMVVSDFILENSWHKRKYRQDQCNEKKLSSFNCIRNICLGKGAPNVWNKLIKKNLYTNNCIQHPKGVNLGEDLAVIIKLLYFAKTIVKLNKGYVHYIYNPKSITRSKYSIKNLQDIEKVLSLNEDFLLEKNFDKNIINILKINHYFTNLSLTRFNNKEEYLKMVDILLELIRENNPRNLKIPLRPLYYFNNRICFRILKYLAIVLRKVLSVI